MWNAMQDHIDIIEAKLHAPRKEHALILGLEMKIFHTLSNRER